MATQALVPFNPQAGAPAHVAQFFDAEGTNIAPKQTVPSLSPEGKMWTISIDGQKTKLQRRNTDGDLEPMPIMKVVILDYNKNRGRAYYEGEYDPNNVSAPICWSDDGIAPDASLPGPFPAGTAIEPGKSRKISAACATCPFAVKGSKTTPQGKAVTACGQHRMLAVIPDPALGLPSTVPPLRLKIAMTSDWDKQSPDQEQQGWLAFSNYIDWIVARNVKHTAALVTKMKFDPDAAYPKIFFAAERYLDPDELATIAPLSKSDEVKKLLGGTFTPAGVDGVPKDQQALASPEPAGEPPATPTEYVMADGEQYTREQYLASGWTDEQLLEHGKMKAVVPQAPAAPAAPPPASVAPPPAAQPAPAATASMVVEEGNATVVEAPAAAAPTATAAEASPAATPDPAVMVVGESPAAPQTSAPAQPAAPPAEQKPAQAEAPPPAATPAAPEPPAAAAKAAEVAPQVSTDVPQEVADLLAEWQ